ncbi:glycosyltransferase [Cryobacterium sp. BB307]|uniref:glycosyltransferase n=1 Tax=Cryobacterium sp. BB307 TaxID=2716317 RepID=UPI001446743B|nr:glycosyltransferase [Cryobacterium sp. BB307]
MPRFPVEYVLPLKWQDDSRLPELVRYLHHLKNGADVTVVDGSPAELFEEHAQVLPSDVRHMRPEFWPGGNGKVAGVMTGVRHARHELVVVADDDVRYGPVTFRALVEQLERADLVRPQNYYDPLPWQARWDTARMLINRAFGADYPGTLGFRRSALMNTGGYDGDVLFENLELIRTITSAGGRETNALDLYVRRLPPTPEQFADQRVRQAYDSLAQPARLAVELALLPAAIATRGRPLPLLVGALTAVAVAEVGRRRRAGRTVFPATSALWAPLWVAERAVTSWVALAQRATGGVRYSGTRIKRAASARGFAGRPRVRSRA